MGFGVSAGGFSAVLGGFSGPGDQGQPEEAAGQDGRSQRSHGW
jgi:hypothetical protein